MEVRKNYIPVFQPKKEGKKHLNGKISTSFKLMSRNYSKADQKSLWKLHQKRDPIQTEIQSTVPSSRMQMGTRSLRMLKVLTADKFGELNKEFKSMRDNWTKKCQLEKLSGIPIASTFRPKPYFKTIHTNLKVFMFYLNYTQPKKCVWGRKR